MKNAELFQLKSGLESVAKLKGVKFGYIVSKNMRKVQSEIEAILKTIEPKEGFTNYEDERLKLCLRYSEKDEEGNPVKKVNNEGNEIYVIADKDKFDKELDKVRKKYKDALEERDAQIKDYEKFLTDEVSDIKFHKIALQHIPEEVTAEQMYLIEPIIAEE